MGNKALKVDGYIFTKVLQYNNSINWRCSLYKKFRCRARAITELDKVGWVRITQKEHTHSISDYVGKSSKLFKNVLPPVSISQVAEKPRNSSPAIGHSEGEAAQTIKTEINFD